MTPKRSSNGVAVANLPSTTTEVAIAVVVELVLLLFATALLARDIRSGFRLNFYSAVLGVFLVHSLTHLGQAIILRRYTPGVISAVAVIPPVGIYVYARLFRHGLLTPRTAVANTGVGVVLVLPVLLFVHFIGRTLGRG